jgi:hypothetical protein
MRNRWMAFARRTLAAAALVGVVLWPAGLRADDDGDEALSDNGAYCSSTAAAAFESCKDGVEADFRLAIGKCINVADAQARSLCIADARDARDEARQLCQDQRKARHDVCAVLGEGRYEPNFNPARFDKDFGNLTHPNPYFPLAIGNKWVFGGAEDVHIKVLDKTKLIAGVTCIAVNDRVTVDGVLSEDTDDWFAQAKNGDVYYAGEQTAEYETFPGDVPPDPELVTTEGSFKTGRDGAKPGIAFFAAPKVGKVYRQEFDLNNAEDLARILSTTYAFGDDPELDRFVPQKLAELLCSGDCVVTKEFTPLNPGPGGVERKYYAPGIGNFLGIDLESGDTVQLVGCNFDTRCNQLPSPE